jgi:P-type E1-E2 ATPase
LTGLSLAFASIPEELPILIKVILAIGSMRLSKVNLLVKRLKTAEALGGITTILTDKTGTLTTNQLNVKLLAVPGIRCAMCNAHSVILPLMSLRNIVQAIHWTVLVQRALVRP